MDAGQPYELFWQLTLREISAILDGAAARMKRKHNAQAWAVWHIAALERMKRLPKLEALLASKARRPKQTVEEQIAIAQQWTAAVMRKR